MADVTVLRKQIKKFVDVATEKELEMAYHLFNASKSTDWWDEISVEQKKSIDKGIKQLNAGQGIPHKQVMKKYSKWLTK